jgi:hypothetical protein
MARIKDKRLVVIYSQDYKDACFAAWYASGKPVKLPKILEVIPVDPEHNHKVGKDMLKRWMNEEGWYLRADALDAEAMQQADDYLIQQKVKMLKEQADRGSRLQQLGMEYLDSEEKNKGFDSASAAVQAVIRGAELERSSRGISEMFAKLVKMDDRELSSTIVGLLTRARDNEQVLDAEEVTETEDDDKSEDKSMSE